ncbi:MAG: polysaccharide biosynthesis tyrosine autokinase [Chloroflexota bacterium]|nr:polysaccharide biosynthesis tyrosine autokinase [Chloroflexota bacterium]
MNLQTELRQYVAILLHWALLLILAAMLSGAAAYYISSRQQRVYQASTTILIDEASGVKAGENYQSILTSERRARTYAQLVTTGPLLESVIEQVGLQITVDRLKSTIDVQAVRDTQLIKVRAQDTDPARAAQIANTLVTRFAAQTQQLQNERYGASRENLKEQIAILQRQIEQTEASLNGLVNDASATPDRSRLEASLTQYRQSYANLLQSYEQVRLAEAQTSSSIVVVEPATAPKVPVSPRVLLNTALAAIVGLLVALGLVFLREALDDSVKQPDLLAEHLGLPILGLISRIKGADKTKPIVVAEPRSPVSEAYRALRANIEFSSVDRPVRSLLITSPAPNEGKSTVSVNLGAIMAQAGRQVAVVDADMRRPTVHKRFDMTNRDGLSELFVKPEMFLNGAMRKTAVQGVSVVTAGVLPPNPAELLGSDKMQGILQQLQDRADLVLLDTPPVTAVTDAVVLSPRVDGVILVLRVGQTKLGAAKQAVEQLRRAGARVLGIVLNDVPTGRSRYGYAYQSYYQQYHYVEKTKPRFARLFGRRNKQESVDV